MGQIYPDVITMSASSFDYLVTSESPADIRDWIQNTRQNYKPWYTGIQTSINNAKADVVANVTASMASLKNVVDKIEASHSQMVAIFNGRKCATYSSYEMDAQNKLTNVMSGVSTNMYSFQSNLYGSIPQSMISSFTSQLQTSMYSSMSGIPALTLIKQVSEPYNDV